MDINKIIDVDNFREKIKKCIDECNAYYPNNADYATSIYKALYDEITFQDLLTKLPLVKTSPKVRIDINDVRIIDKFEYHLKIKLDYIMYRTIFGNLKSSNGTHRYVVINLYKDLLYNNVSKEFIDYQRDIYLKEKGKKTSDKEINKKREAIIKKFKNNLTRAFSKTIERHRDKINYLSHEQLMEIGKEAVNNAYLKSSVFK